MTNESFSQFVGQYEKLVFTVCFQMVRDYQEAQNLSQETFLSAFRNIDRCPPEHYKPWLCRIATNKAKDHLKSAYARRVSAPGEEAMDALPAQGSPEEWLLAEEGETRIQERIRRCRNPITKSPSFIFSKKSRLKRLQNFSTGPKNRTNTALSRQTNFARTAGKGA